MDYNNPELFKVFCMAIFTLLVISCSIIILHYAFTEIFTLASILINNMLFNYTHNLPLFANSKDVFKQTPSCWVCNKVLLKTEYTTQIHCPCNKLFHSKCIERYLLLHKNICPDGHRIEKFKNEV